MHGDAVQAMAVSLLSMLIVLEAAWAGSAPCNVTSIDVAAYDTEHSGTVVIEGCQWRQSTITLLFSQPATVVVQHVTLEGGTFTAAGSAASGRFPSGSRLTIINSSATGCVDCFSVNADVLAGFSLVVVGSTLRGTHTAASIHSTNATDCTISITHSSVSTTASGPTDALSACVWGRSPLVATRLQLSSEHSSIGSTSSGEVACSLGIASHYGAVTLKTVDVAVSFSNIVSSAVSLTETFAAAASVAFATTDNPISAMNVVMKAANSNIISVVNCLTYTPAASFGFSSDAPITVENCSMFAVNCSIASTTKAFALSGGMTSSASLGFASFAVVKVTSFQLVVSSSTIDAEASSLSTQGGYAHAASGAAVSVNAVNVVNMQLSSSKSAVTARVKCLASYGAAGALGLASYPSSVTARNISILSSSSNVSATSSAGTNCVAAASGIAGKTLSIADCVIYAKDSNVSSETLVSSAEPFASSMSCVSFANLHATNVSIYSLSSTVSANARGIESNVAAAAMGFAAVNDEVSVNFITVYAFNTSARAVASGRHYVAAASLGVAGLSPLQSNDTVFYAVNSTHVVIATATSPIAVYASAAVVGLATFNIIRCSRIILYIVQCNCTSEASAPGQYVSAATVGFASACNQIRADGVVASASQSTVSARAYSADCDVAAAAGAATTSSLKGGNISIHVIRSNVTATASSSSSCAGGAGVAAWNPPDKLSVPTIISVCQSSVTAVSRAARATAASYAQRLVVLDSRVQSKYCLSCDAAPSNTTLCNLDVSHCASMGWSLKGNASGSANTIVNTSVMTSKEVRSAFPGLAVADQCAMQLSDCPSVASPSVVVPIVDFPLSPIPAIETATHWVSESTVIEPTSRSSTHSAPVTRSVSAATLRSLSLGPVSHSLPLSYTSTPTPSLNRQLGRAPPGSSAQIAVLSSVVSESSARAIVASGVAASAVAGIFASPGGRCRRDTHRDGSVVGGLSLQRGRYEPVAAAVSAHRRRGPGCARDWCGFCMRPRSLVCWVGYGRELRRPLSEHAPVGARAERGGCAAPVLRPVDGQWGGPGCASLRLPGGCAELLCVRLLRSVCVVAPWPRSSMAGASRGAVRARSRGRSRDDQNALGRRASRAVRSVLRHVSQRAAGCARLLLCGAVWLVASWVRRWVAPDERVLQRRRGPHACRRDRPLRVRGCALAVSMCARQCLRRHHGRLAGGAVCVRAVAHAGLDDVKSAPWVDGPVSVLQPHCPAVPDARMGVGVAGSAPVCRRVGFHSALAHIPPRRAAPATATVRQPQSTCLKRGRSDTFHPLTATEGLYCVCRSRGRAVHHKNLRTKKSSQCWCALWHTFSHTAMILYTLRKKLSTPNSIRGALHNTPSFSAPLHHSFL